MKKQLIALSVCGAFCGLAHAEGGSVTVYGVIDAGFMSASKACTNTACSAGGTNANPPNAGGTTGSVTAFQDAQYSPSSYGLKGKEDLGGGLYADFNLLGGFNAGNGTHNSPGVYQTQIFGEEAKVGLGGDWGMVHAGLQIDPAFIAAIGTEARGMTDSLSSIEHWIIASVGNNFALQAGVFDANSISYTYEGNGLFLGVLYGVGGVAGSTSAGSQMSIGASYKIQGFTIAAGYVEGKANGVGALGGAPADPTYNGTSSKIDHIGVGYEFGPYAVRAQYGEYKNNYNSAGTNLDDVKNFNVGFDWKSGANKLNLAYYNSKDNGTNLGGKTTEFALLDSYNLSKRTFVYAQVASVKVDSYTFSGGGIATGPGESSALGGIYTPVGLFAVAGETTTFVGVGLHHAF